VDGAVDHQMKMTLDCSGRASNRPTDLLAAVVCCLSFQIFIKTLTGRKQAFNFEPENQVLAVKQALQEKEGIQVDQIRLIHSGKQLADDKTLESYNIAAGATIHMVLQLRGGQN
jgi:hypothetical protein